jgi:hypothetical protein
MGNWHAMIDFFGQIINRPPFRLILVLGGMLLISIQGWIRFIYSIINWHIYEVFQVIPGVWYLTISGLFSGCVYFAAAWLTILNIRKYRRYSAGLLAAGLAGFWFDRVFVTVSTDARVSLPFTLLTSLILTSAAIGILYWDTIFDRKKLQEK